MPETEPKYFTEFKNLIIKRFDRIDHDFIKVYERLDGHAEQIAALAVDVTTIKHLLKHKADRSDLDKLELHYPT